ncbi:MAG: BatA domain-containing protein [candidate division WOR-3 bacterium]
MSFLNPFFLYLLPLASIPIIIHLLHRVRLKKIQFSSLFFLKETKKERFAWLRLREFLLLFFRTAFLFFLFLSLTKPQWQKSPFPLKRERSLVLILDDTYSMMAKFGGKDNFSRAKEKAKELLATLTPNSEVAFFLLSGRLRRDFSPQETVLTILDTLSCSYLSPKLKGEEIKRVIPLARFPIEIFFFTDGQKNCLDFLRSLPSEVSVFLLREKVNNCGITDVYWQERLALPGEANHIAVRIKNYSEEEAFLHLKLAQEKIKESLAVSLKPKEEKEFAFTTEFREAGDYSGKVEISTDSLLVDNIRYFALRKLGKIPLLLVSEEEGKVSFLKKAIMPSPLSPFSLTSLPISALKGVNLASYPVLILVDPINLTPEDKERIVRYLKGGGSLFLSLFSQPKISLWEEFFTYEGNRKEEGFLRIEQVDTAHPVTEMIKEGIKEAKVFAYSSIKPKGLKPILSLTGGKPLLLEGERILVATTLFHPDFTNLVYKGIFVPFLYRLLFYLSDLPLRKEYLCGDTIRVSSPEPTLTVKTPLGSFIAQAEIKGGRMEYHLPQTPQPGIYELGKEKFSVNPEPKEGDLTGWEDKELGNLKIKLIEEIPKGRVDLTPFVFYLTFISLFFEFLLLLL